MGVAMAARGTAVGEGALKAKESRRAFELNFVAFILRLAAAAGRRCGAHKREARRTLA
jgi:hypothetical protein